MKGEIRWGAAAVLGIAILAGSAAAESESSFSVLLRLQPELVHVSGSAAEARDGEGFFLTDGWGAGRKNSHNWGALFIDGSHPIGRDIEVFGRFGFNVNMQGLADGDARQREVQAGIRGPFGQVLAGRLETPYKLAALGWDPLNATFMQARANIGRSGGAFGHGGYVDNALEYSLSRESFALRLFAAVDDIADIGSGSTAGNHAWAASLSAPVGPVELMLAHIDASEFDGGPDKRTGTKLGLRYRQADWTLAGHFEFRGRGLEDGDFLFLTAERATGSWRLAASHGRFEHDGEVGNDGRYYALGARYAFSRQFSVHGGVRRTRRDVSGSENIVGLGFRVIFDTGNLLTR